MNYYSFSLLLGIAASFICCHCQVITPLGNVCIGQQVETQCEVNGSELNALTWRVYYANGTQYGSDISFTNSMDDTKIDDSNGEFTFERLSTDPLIISRILFTAQSSINGYSVSCQDNIMKTFSNFTIIVYDNPGDVIIHTDTFTNSSVNISWTESPSYCNTTYEYNVSSSALEENIIMNSTSNSVMVEGLVPSDDQYCTVVTAKDQYSVRQSDESCFIFNVPSQVRNLTLDITMNSACISATWNEPVILDIDGIVVPKLIGYTVSIVNSANDYINETELLPPAANSTLFCNIKPLGHIYKVNVTAINGVGSNTSSNAIDVPPSADTTMPSSSSNILPTSFINNESAISNTTDESSTHDVNSIRVTPLISPTDILVSTSVTTSPNDDSNEGGNLSSGKIVAIVIVPAVIAIIVLLAVLVSVGIYFIVKRYFPKSKA